VIRDVIVHVLNEQPLIADIYAVPDATDAGLLCTNLRLKDGKRPVFIDKIENTFFFPYRMIRFLEITDEALDRHRADAGQASPTARAAATAAAAELIAGGSETRLPAVVEAPGGADTDAGEEIDEDFLRRIREI
jgi:hypothetical protein